MVNVHPVKLGRNERQDFSHIHEVLEMPNLIEVQKKSYQWLLTDGLKEVLRDMGTIEDYTGNLVLDFISYRLDEEPKYSVEECKARDATYNAPLRVKARLLNKETGEIKEQEIFMGGFPLMTDSGTFVINGAERVIVSQMVRSPGVYFSFVRDKSGKQLFAGQMIPNRGAWLEYETDSNDVMYVRIDKTRKSLGNTVEITHPGGWTTRYRCLGEITVSQGQHVSRGQIIGTVGMSGSSFSPHLHYEVMYRKDYQNPALYLDMDISPQDYFNMVRKPEQ